MKLPWDSKQVQQKTSGKYVRERSADLYHTARWTKLSRSFRERRPLCEVCASKGIIKEAQITDHITPWPICGKEGFFNENNLQALCQECNHIKGQQDKKLIQEWKRTDMRERG